MRKVFSHIYSTDDLISSFDVLILWRPWWSKESDAEALPSSSSLHMDQNPFSKPGFHCVQGMLPLYSVTEHVGGTVLVPYTHSDQAQERLRNSHPKWGQKENLHRDFCVLNNEDILQGKEMLARAEPGDLLLWDSRLVHAGSVGAGRGDQELARASVCISLGPRKHATAEVLQKRKEALEQGWHFSHWPWEAMGNKGQIS